MKIRKRIVTPLAIYVLLFSAFSIIIRNYTTTAQPSNGAESIENTVDNSVKDMQVTLVVYPNGTIGLDGIFNFTQMDPPNTGPLMNTTLSVSTMGETTTGSANGTIILPNNEMFEWPFNSTTANLALQCDDGLLDATMDATIFIPPVGRTTYPTNASDFLFNSSYSDGLLNVELWGETEIPSYDSMLPFNVTDFTVLADYVENEINGNITFYISPGVPSLDVIVYFDGNKTDLFITGNLTVIYGDYFGMEINATTLDQMLVELNSTIPGQGPDSLYNMTWGLLECTQLNTTKTPLYFDIEEIGAEIKYNATIHGNFTGLLAKLLTEMLFGYSPEEVYPLVYAALDSALSSVQSASLILDHYHTSGIASIDLYLASDVKALWNKALHLVPPTAPEENRTLVEAWLKIANATAYAIKDFSFNASYSSAAQELILDAWLSANITQLEDDILPILPDTVPPELQAIVESYVDTTYWTLTSSNATFSYTNGTANFETSWILEGDFKTQINQAKRFYIDLLNATSPSMLTWQLRMLNETEININNFGLEFKLGQDWMYLNFNGLIAQPPKDEIDFIRFRLHRFFNMTADPEEPPREFEKLKIVVAGGFNGTHTILLHAPGPMPTPNVTSLDYKTMTWENVTISSLRDLLFKIAYQEDITYLGKTYYVPIFTNSTVSNFGFDQYEKSISFNVTGTTGTGFCDVTIPRALLYAALGNWTVKIDGITLSAENFTVTENDEYMFISLNYPHSDHTIEIVGTWVITEFQPSMLLVILIILTLIAAIIAVKQRKKLDTLKTKYQSLIRTFANRLYELKT
jgi:hypothetical protein